MKSEEIDRIIQEFCDQTHGSTNYHKEDLFVMGESDGQYAPLKYLIKKNEGVQSEKELLKEGYVFMDFDFAGGDDFIQWFENQFGRKLLSKKGKAISIIKKPKNKEVFDAIAKVHEAYDVLRNEKILVNGKNLPTQLGEWFAKCIFGLLQKKSTSQRGFDFYLDGKRVEVKVHWADLSSPKGVKIKKSLVQLSDYCILIYIARNFMIREICILDSNFIMRKLAGKGHTIFLKDSDLSPYFFSNSSKHLDKVANSNSLLKFSSPNFAMKLTEYFQ